MYQFSRTLSKPEEQLELHVKKLTTAYLGGHNRLRGTSLIIYTKAVQKGKKLEKWIRPEFRISYEDELSKRFLNLLLKNEKESDQEFKFLLSENIAKIVSFHAPNNKMELKSKFMAPLADRWIWLLEAIKSEDAIIVEGENKDPNEILPLISSDDQFDALINQGPFLLEKSGGKS